jgi:hypothetical protein
MLGVDFLEEVPFCFPDQEGYTRIVWRITYACQSGVGRRVLMENRDKQDGIRSWRQLAQQYETDGNRNVRIKRI